MRKKKTTEQAIIEATKKHGGFYSYERFIYLNSAKPACVTCPIHGDFWQRPNDHINKGDGCPECGLIARANKRRGTAEQFIKKARKIHGDYFDYSKVVYKNNSTKITITCPVHGDIRILPDNHISRQSGCRKCLDVANASRQRMSLDEFVRRAREMHGSQFDYSDINYKNRDTKITIICKDHGPVTVHPRSHLSGNNGCPNCFEKSKAENVLFEFLYNRFSDYNTIFRNTRPIKNIQGTSRLELDIIFVEAACAIEYNGDQHYNKDSYFNKIGTSKTSIFDRDEYKRQWCKERNIKLIEIPYWEFSMSHTKQQRDEYLEDLATILEEYL